MFSGPACLSSVWLSLSIRITWKASSFPQMVLPARWSCLSPPCFLKYVGKKGKDLHVDLYIDGVPFSFIQTKLRATWVLEECQWWQGGSMATGVGFPHGFLTCRQCWPACRMSPLQQVEDLSGCGRGMAGKCCSYTEVRSLADEVELAIYEVHGECVINSLCSLQAKEQWEEQEGMAFLSRGGGGRRGSRI